MPEPAELVRKPAAEATAQKVTEGAVSTGADAVANLLNRRAEAKLAAPTELLQRRAKAAEVAAPWTPVRKPGPQPVQRAASGGEAVVQRYTLRPDGAKVSQNGRFITDETGHVDALPGSAVDMSVNTGVVGDGTYERWVPQFDVIGDCVAAMEEIMHAKKLKYGVPGASKYRDLKPKKTFGGSDAMNRKRGRESDLGPDADPAKGQAYLIARQTYKTDEDRPQFHGAAVVAQDGSDNVTLEATAPPAGPIAAVRVRPVYDMYGTLKRQRKQSFKSAYQAEYGKDATVSVLEAVKPLPLGAEAPARSKKVIDF